MKGTWIRQPSGDTTIVFVHGIFSSGNECWRDPVRGSYWPEIVRDDRRLEGTGIYVYDYMTAIDSGTYSIRDAAHNLFELLKLDGVSSRRLAFVCHSMGGIVVRKCLVDHRTEFIDGDRVIVLLLVASPSLGSNWASWLLPLSELVGNAQARALRSVSAEGEFLETVDRDFKDLKEGGRLPIIGRELVEDRALVGKRRWAHLWVQPIVEPLSGGRYFGNPFKVPGSDHSTIAKPADENAAQHRLLEQLLQHPAALPSLSPASLYAARLESTLSHMAVDKPSIAEDERALLRRGLLQLDDLLDNWVAAAEFTNFLPEEFFRSERSPEEAEHFWREGLVAAKIAYNETPMHQGRQARDFWRFVRMPRDGGDPQVMHELDRGAPSADRELRRVLEIYAPDLVASIRELAMDRQTILNHLVAEKSGDASAAVRKQSLTSSYQSLLHAQYALRGFIRQHYPALRGG